MVRGTEVWRPAARCVRRASITDPQGATGTGKVDTGNSPLARTVSAEGVSIGADQKARSGERWCPRSLTR
ncbi:MAG: hypothetical protein ACRDQ1_04675 [Sciscionella sp.]